MAPTTSHTPSPSESDTIATTATLDPSTLPPAQEKDRSALGPSTLSPNQEKEQSTLPHTQEKEKEKAGDKPQKRARSPSPIRLWPATYELNLYCSLICRRKHMPVLRNPHSSKAQLAFASAYNSAHHGTHWQRDLPVSLIIDTLFDVMQSRPHFMNLVQHSSAQRSTLRLRRVFWRAQDVDREEGKHGALRLVREDDTVTQGEKKAPDNNHPKYNPAGRREPQDESWAAVRNDAQPPLTPRAPRTRPVVSAAAPRGKPMASVLRDERARRRRRERLRDEVEGYSTGEEGEGEVPGLDSDWSDEFDMEVESSDESGVEEDLLTFGVVARGRKREISGVADDGSEAGAPVTPTR